MNKKSLKAKDIVEVEIILTNVSGERLEKIAYVEKVKEIFTLNKESIQKPEDSEVSFNIP